MLPPILKQTLLDKLGLVLSVGCAIHCLVMACLPLLLPSVLQAGCCHAGEGMSFHSVSALFVFLIALAAFAKPCSFRDKGKLLKLMGGLALIFSPHVATILQSYETALTVFGTALVASAHWQNMRSCQRARGCDQ